MQATAPMGVVTRPSCVKNIAGPMNPICTPRTGRQQLALPPKPQSMHTPGAPSCDGLSLLLAP